jgi:hypothetical protein
MKMHILIFVALAFLLGCEEEKPLTRLEPSCLKLSENTMMEELLVSSASASIEENTVNLVLMVNAAINKTRAKQLGDNFLRLTKSLCNDGPAASKEIGATNYTYMVGVFESLTGKEIEMGAKVPRARRITW